ncbi:MAG: 30S ribosomal protein S21 [Clostridiales bacterium]|jgi:ribosomal protein S21|nr:30S ribosomal protein S21 [Clostridiales bacterium]
MATIVPKKNESSDAIVKRFTNQCKRERIQQDFRKHEEWLPKAVKLKKKREEARKKNKRKKGSFNSNSNNN